MAPFENSHHKPQAEFPFSLAMWQSATQDNAKKKKIAGGVIKLQMIFPFGFQWWQWWDSSQLTLKEFGYGSLYLNLASIHLFQAVDKSRLFRNNSSYKTRSLKHTILYPRKGILWYLPLLCGQQWWSSSQWTLFCQESTSSVDPSDTVLCVLKKAKAHRPETCQDTD